MDNFIKQFLCSHKYEVKNKWVNYYYSYFFDVSIEDGQKIEYLCSKCLKTKEIVIN